MHDTVTDAYEKHLRGEVVGLPTGFYDLDRLLGGLQKSDLIIIAGRPSTVLFQPIALKFFWMANFAPNTTESVMTYTSFFHDGSSSGPGYVTGFVGALVAALLIG